jgi:hypothetical protein
MSQTTSIATLVALRRLLLATWWFGLAGTGAELLLMGHVEDGWQLVPVILVALAGLARVAMVVARSTSGAAAAMWLFRGVMVMLMLSGVTGAVLHYRANMEFKREMDPSLSGFKLFSTVVQAKAPPTLAPGTMTLLGVLGLASVFRLDVPTSSRNP